MGFSDFFLRESTSTALTSNKALRLRISQCLESIQNSVNGSEFLKELLLEAPVARNKRKNVSDDHRRYMTPEEEEIYYQYLNAGENPSTALRKMFTRPGKRDKGNFGQLPAVEAWMKALGLDVDSVAGMKRGDFKDLDLDAINLQQVKQNLMQITGKSNPSDLLPEHWKEALEKKLLRDVRDKLNSGQQLTPKEQSVYEVWKQVKSSVGQTVGNRQGYNKMDRPSEDNPFMQDGGAGHDSMFLRMSNPGLVKRNTPIPPAEKARLQGQLKTPQSHLSHYNPMLENQKLFPDEIALNIDDTYKKMKEMGYEILNADEALDMYLMKVKDDIMSGKAFAPNPGTEDQAKRYGRWAQTMQGVAAASSGISNPVTNPGDLQALTGVVRPIVRDGGKDKFGDAEPHPNLPDDLPNPYIALNKERVAFPDSKINKMYNQDDAAWEQEVMAPARWAASKYFRPHEIDDAAQEIAMMMLGATGIHGWRESEPLRKHWAKLYAWRHRDQLLKHNTKVKTGMQSAGEDGEDLMAGQAGKGYTGGEAMTDKERAEIRRQAKDLFNFDIDMPPEDANLLQQASGLMAQAKKDQDPNMGRQSLDLLKQLATKYGPIKDYLAKLGIVVDDGYSTNSMDDDDY